MAGMHTLTFDDPASKVVGDNKPTCVGSRALRSTVVDVRDSNEVSARRTRHDTDAEMIGSAASGPRSVATGAS